MIGAQIAFNIEKLINIICIPKNSP
jgi:hypothetical protein